LAFVRRFALGRGAAVLAMQMVSVAIGWQLYERTHDPWSLGLVGLVELIPVVLFLLPAGSASDRFPRRNVAALASALLALAAAGLAIVSARESPLWITYALLALVGAARAFGQPAVGSLLPELVAAADRARMNAWIASTFEFAAIAGPALAGLLIAATGGAALPLALAALGQIVFVVMLLTLPARPPQGAGRPHGASELLAGFRFIRSNQVFLAAITLDLLAVLLGGAVALLPVYAKDILRVGPIGLGWLRTAPALGALLMFLAATRLPPWRRPGRVLLLAVVGFGLATIGFGFSRNYLASLACLFLIGAFDAVSVVIRMTLEQNLTPDALRGRVSAINYLFIGFSNELGSFESGAVAAWLGPVVAVAGGGIGALLVVGGVALAWPALAAIGPLHLLAPAEAAQQP
jgi:MFS family permease